MTTEQNLAELERLRKEWERIGREAEENAAKTEKVMAEMSLARDRLRQRRRASRQFV
jgi:ribosome-binding ATPase YchF (GTP1/OBG family)